MFLSSSDRDLGVPLELQQDSQTSYWVEVGNSGFLLIWKRGVDPSLNLQGGTQGSS